MWTEITQDGSPLAALVHDPALSLQPATAAAIALALERERLAADLRAHVLELRASRARIVTAGDDARRRIERDLHDGAQQRLVSLLLNLQLERRASCEARQPGQPKKGQVRIVRAPGDHADGDCSPGGSFSRSCGTC